MPTNYSKLVDLTLTTSSANTSSTIPVPEGGQVSLALEAIFTYGSGGTSAKSYVQTSFDNGVTWMDIACFAFATSTASKVANLVSTVAMTTMPAPTDGSLTDNTAKSGPIGRLLRAKTLVDGTYAGGTTLAIHAIARS